MTTWFDQYRTLLLAAVVIVMGCALYLILRPAAINGLAPLAVFVAAATAAIAGFAFSPICGALLFHLWDTPLDVVRVLMVCSIANQITSVYLLRRDIRWHRLLPFLLPGLFGVPLGITLLLLIDATSYIAGFGVLLILHSTFILVCSPRPAPDVFPSHVTWGDRVIGFLGGVVGGLAATPGMPLVMWLTHRGGGKAEHRALFQPFILILQCEALVMLAAIESGRPVPTRWDWTVLAFIPLSVIGTWCGVAAFRRLTDRQFVSVTHAMMIVAGLALVV